MTYKLAYPLSCPFFHSTHCQPQTTAKIGSFAYTTDSEQTPKLCYFFFSSYIMVGFVSIIPWPLHPENIMLAQSRSLRRSESTPSRVLSVELHLHHARTNSSISLDFQVVLTSTFCVRARLRMLLPPAFCHSSGVPWLQRTTGHVGNVLDLWTVEHIARQRTPQAACRRQDPVQNSAKRAPTRTWRSRPLLALRFPVVVLSILSAVFGRAPHRVSFTLSPGFFLQP